MTFETGPLELRNGDGHSSRPPNRAQFLCVVSTAMALMADCTADSQTVTTAPSAEVKHEPPPGVVREIAAADCLWSFQFGVGVISDNTLSDYKHADFDPLDGPGGGITYNFTFSRQWTEFDWRIGEIHLRPQLERVAMLTLVDENTGRVIPDINLGLVFRWQDFPWNRFVRTTLAAGPGFSYSFQIWTADKQRHPGEDRSRLKFWLPIEFTAALPCYPRHQVVAFIDHQSGGHLFDDGGVDAWGFGYRFEF
jgi:hypothetical protein